MAATSLVIAASLNYVRPSDGYEDPEITAAVNDAMPAEIPWKQLFNVSRTSLQSTEGPARAVASVDADALITDLFEEASRSVVLFPSGIESIGGPTVVTKYSSDDIRVEVQAIASGRRRYDDVAITVRVSRTDWSGEMLYDDTIREHGDSGARWFRAASPNAPREGIVSDLTGVWIEGIAVDGWQWTTAFVRHHGVVIKIAPQFKLSPDQLEDLDRELRSVAARLEARYDAHKFDSICH